MLIKNAKLANNELVDILIQSGKFVKIEKNIEITGEEILNLQGKYILPGMVDVHTHMRERIVTGKQIGRAHV